ncbi:diaminopimelate decarboxylase [Salinicoccus sp. YB14-2]|uniref:diaminopimelate decarboxylase n=1 Tax=Salinicoccus sp. YB14-2 TaxID=1572701 RepID=UPI000689CDE8|nr:diaminopimelate decarboxylase [Salinicoccus sp. YB14-2]
MTLEYHNDKLQFSGQDVTNLADQYGTPLIIYDEVYMRDMMRRFHAVLSSHLDNYSVSYASKAFTALQMINLLKEEDMEIDVVSSGELYTAIKGGFSPSLIKFHGNNKTAEELEFALDQGVGLFIIDSLDEVKLLNDLAKDPVDVLIRVNPGVDVDTHDFISTGQTDSKFGLSIVDGTALKAVIDIDKAENLNFKGIHYHLGSQLSDPAPFVNALTAVYDWLKDHEIEIEILNMGGGFGVRYTDEDIRFPIEEGFDEILTELKTVCNQYDLELPHVMIEPGRSIAAEAAVTIYKVGTVKDIPGVSRYASIDGGMSDHIRTPLYGAEYDILPVKKQTDDVESISTHVVGKLCESGDIIGKNKLLPSNIERGDYVAVKTTGAYHYSMASNYNQMQKPAVIFISPDGVKQVIKRQTLDQLIQNDVLIEQ